MQVTPSLEEMAELVVKYLVKENMGDCVEYSAKTQSFRLKVDPSDTPDDIAAALRKCTKVTSTVFGGKLGVRVRLLASSLLTAEPLSQLRSLTALVKFADAVDKMLQDKIAGQKMFAKEVYKELRR